MVAKRETKPQYLTRIYPIHVERPVAVCTYLFEFPRTLSLFSGDLMISIFSVSSSTSSASLSSFIKESSSSELIDPDLSVERRTIGAEGALVYQDGLKVSKSFLFFTI